MRKKKKLVPNIIYKLIINENENIKKNLLIALTEAPNMNLKDWFTNSYTYKDVTKQTRTQTNNGYQITEVWESILFQLFYTFLIMMIHGVRIENLNLENIFIKNISDNQKIYGYWIYEILGLKFYVKNYGFLILIDSNFKNYVNFNNIITDNDLKKEFNKKNYILCKQIFNDIIDNEILNDDAKAFILKIYSTLNIDEDSFDFESNNLKTALIRRIIYLFGNNFLHSKLGYDIEESAEKKFKIPKSGDIINNENKYAIFFNLDGSNFIIRKIDDEIDVDPISDVGEYYVYENLENKLNNDGSKFDLKQLLDTYVLK